MSTALLPLDRSVLPLPSRCLSLLPSLILTEASRSRPALCLPIIHRPFDHVSCIGPQQHVRASHPMLSDPVRPLLPPSLASPLPSLQDEPATAAEATLNAALEELDRIPLDMRLLQVGGGVRGEGGRENREGVRE